MSTQQKTGHYPTALSIREQAKKYRELGFNIIPLKYGQKTPALKWEEFQHRKLSQTEFETAFAATKLVNIGVVCGTISGNLVSLDFDDINNFNRFFPNQTKLQQEAPIIQSSRGRHIWLRTTEPVKSFTVPQLCLDVLGEGKLAVAPPSRHPDGTIYSFLNPDLIEPIQVSDFQEAILERCKALHVQSPNTPQASYAASFAAIRLQQRELDPEAKDAIVEAITPFWVRGHRHYMCMFLLGAVIKAGVNQTTASELIERIADSAHDEEKHERLRQVADHYKKPASFLPKLKGLSGLKELLDP